MITFDSRQELVDISQRMWELAGGKESKISQGTLEWFLFRAVSDVKKIDLFSEMDNEDEI